MDNSQSWSVIIFCFNEEKSIQTVFSSANEVLKKMTGENYEIIIVDDGSIDQSPSIIKEIAGNNKNVIPVFHSENKGIGQTLRSGYDKVRFENVSAIPADGQFDVSELLAHPTVPAKTFISFYRKENLQYSLFRNILSYINKLVNDYFLGIKLKDVNWVKIYKREELMNLDLQIESSLIESEICSKLFLRGNKVIESVSVYHPRKGGESKGASLKIVLQALKDTWKLIKVVNRYKSKYHYSFQKA